MDRRYWAYCLADPTFYDLPERAAGDAGEFPVATRPAPAGWSRADRADWRSFTPDDARLPAQGWKIHASARLLEARATLEAIWDHCVPRGIGFKVVRSDRLLLLRSAKYADRGSSGKLATIYPRDEAELERVLHELGETLHGVAGPYVLSDLRWRDGPLYVRYGALFERALVDRDGRRRLVIEHPDGRLLPDRRGPTFALPQWVEPPACLTPALAARAASSIEAMPYRVERALHFSNGGGLYLAAHRRSGERVVLKEARPHAGLGGDGSDAVARLERERDMLEALGGLDCVPGLRDFFRLDGHSFLVREYAEGAVLNSLVVERHPLLGPEVDDADLAAYTDWALDLLAAVERAVARVHARGIVIGDLQPANIIVRPDGEIALIDFEAAFEESSGARPAIATPGFLAPAGRTGFDIDRHALACLRLYPFLPLAPVVGLDPAKAAHLAGEIAELFPVPPDFLADAVALIGPSRSERPQLDPDDFAGARSALVASLLASATPEREDRLFPGDVDGFAPGGAINLANGAAGVLLALDAAGVEPAPGHVDWLRERAAAAPADMPVGLYDGLHGVAHVLARLGHARDASELLDRCAERGTNELGLDLFGGLAGIGLNLLGFGEPDAARSVAAEVAERLGPVDAVPDTSGGANPRAGLLYGSSGPALLFTRLHERTDDPALLDLAATALRQDLRRCVTTASGTLQVNEGWRTLPYLADGSAGIGLVIEAYLARREDPELAEAARAIRGAARSGFYIQPGLGHGRAGMLLALGRDDPDVRAHVRRLAWHAVGHGGGLAFPGEQLLRLSSDLLTGTAGVLLALAAALGDYSVGLPFLAAPADGATADGEDLITTREGG